MIEAIQEWSRKQDEAEYMMTALNYTDPTCRTA